MGREGTGNSALTCLESPGLLPACCTAFPPSQFHGMLWCIPLLSDVFMGLKSCCLQTQMNFAEKAIISAYAVFGELLEALKMSPELGKWIVGVLILNGCGEFVPRVPCAGLVTLLPVPGASKSARARSWDRRTREKGKSWKICVRSLGERLWRFSMEVSQFPLSLDGQHVPPTDHPSHLILYMGAILLPGTVDFLGGLEG